MPTINEWNFYKEMMIHIIGAAAANEPPPIPFYHFKFSNEIKRKNKTKEFREAGSCIIIHTRLLHQYKMLRFVVGLV
jgi:hypothetical protein